jgi:acetone carboxylase gamma subunit
LLCKQMHRHSDYNEAIRVPTGSRVVITPGRDGRLARCESRSCGTAALGCPAEQGFGR